MGVLRAMIWTNYFAVLATLSLTPVFVLVWALFFVDDKYASKIFIYCLTGCVLGSVMWIALGVGLGVTVILEGR